MQLNQQPLMEIILELAKLSFAMPDVEERPSLISVHALGRFGLVPPSIVMLYAPRDEGELCVAGGTR